MTLIAKCICGHNFYHCDGNGGGNCLNRIIVKDLDWWKPEEIPKRLFELRKMAKVTTRKVEQETGITNPYLSQLENGKIKNPSYAKVYTLKAYYESIINAKQ